MSEIMPTFHYPDGRRVVGWPGSWAHAITSRRPLRARAAPWVAGMDCTLRAMVNASAPWEQIAETLERSEQAVRMRASRLGLTGREARQRRAMGLTL